MKLLRARWVLVAAMALSLVGLARMQQYYGHIYHGWDAQFYYSVAHSFLFDRDADITNNLTSTPHAKPFDPRGDGSWSEAPRVEGRIPSKYPIGLSLAEIPFLAVGHLVRRAVEITGRDVPGAVGYSAVEIWTVAIGLQLVFAAGLAVLYRLVSEEYGRPGAILGVLGCWLGTSLFYYSALFPFMAHAVSFTLLALILHATRGLTTDGHPNRRLMWLGLLLGALFLVRPQQVVVAVFLLPAFVSVARTRPAAVWGVGAGVGVVLCLAAIAAQVAFNSTQFGVLTLGGYAVGGEGFSWAAPQLSFVLSSPSRGLLSFSPVVTMAVVGYVLFRRSVPGYVWPAVGNAVAQVYLIAAWSSPEQGESFGARMWSDNAAVVAIGVAVAFLRAGTIGRAVLIVATALAIGWSMFLLVRYI